MGEKEMPGDLHPLRPLPPAFSNLALKLKFQSSKIPVILLRMIRLRRTLSLALTKIEHLSKI
jgi:hypothetical protein